MVRVLGASYFRLTHVQDPHPLGIATSAVWLKILLNSHSAGLGRHADLNPTWMPQISEKIWGPHGYTMLYFKHAEPTGLHGPQGPEKKEYFPATATCRQAVT